MRISSVVAILLACASALAGCGKGRPVACPDAPRPRLATFSPALTTLVVDIGLGEHIVGVTSQETVPLPGRAILGDAMNVSTEAILAARPDILLVQMAEKSFDAVRSSNREIKVEHFDIETLEDVGLAMERIGRLAGKEEIGSRAKAEFQDRLAKVAARVAGKGRPKVLFVMGYQDNISTVGGNTFVGEMIQAAGGQNVAAAASGWIDTNRDYILSKAPDVVVCWTDAGQEAAAKAHWSSLPGLPAAATGRVFAVSDRYWTIPTGRTAGLVEELAQMIHPDVAWASRLRGRSRYSAAEARPCVSSPCSRAQRTDELTGGTPVPHAATGGN